MKIVTPIPAEHIPAAVALYWQTFGSKLAVPLGPDTQARAFVARVFDPAHGICALDHDGTLLGVVGFKTHAGALVGGSFGDIRAVYGSWGGIWRVATLVLLEHDTDNDNFLMDGLFVAPHARNRGVGTALIDAITRRARTSGYAAVRLDVVDTNPRARALYERYGFAATKTRRLGLRRHIFGFRATTTMLCPTGVFRA